MHRLAFAAALLLLAELLAAAQCRPFNRTPACCPRPPVACCPAGVAAPVDDELVLSVCGPSESKGEAYVLDECKRYFGKKDLVSEVAFSRLPGGATKLAELRKQLAGPRAKLVDLRVPGASATFLVRDLDETGATERVSLWGVVGSEVVHLSTEVAVCNEAQATTLFSRAIERLAPAREGGLKR